MELGLCILLLPLSLLFASIQQVVAAPFDSIAPVLELRDSRFSNFALQNRALPTGTCNADTPCVNAACCGIDGLCGYSPTQCGSGNCTSNCDAKAQCGQYGTTGSQTCPLDVCCSEFGFCGSTSDFCDKGCQAGFGGCGEVVRPSCSASSSSKRTIGYYEAWSNTRTCDAVSPEDLNLNGLTHINFAFAFFDPTTFQIAPMDAPSGELFSRFTALKAKANGLQAWISVGGWSFTDPGPTRSAFSDMTSSAGNRQQFITGLLAFMNHYSFDGVDLDWEYPQADDRGGVTADTANYVSLVTELRAALGTKYGISMTLPTSYWYLQHFDLKNIAPSVDWFNFMTYDLHGVWDAASLFLGPYINPHTNVTEIDMGLDLLWRAGVKPAQVNLGLAWYGRSFTLSDPSCSTPNGVCQFTGGANAGPCTDASGILDLEEIENIIKTNSLTPVWDKTAAVKWITWDSNQWVSYDDDDTFQQKRTFANSRCLGGTMIWAIDQRDQTADNGLAAAPGITTQNQADAKQMSDNLAAGVTCYTTDCNVACKTGTNEVTQMDGQPNQLSTNGRCSAGQHRNLCCSDGTTMGTCQWRGYRGMGLSCMGGCADGETEIVKDTNSFDKSKGAQACTGGTQSYCCKGFTPAPSGSDLKTEAEDAAKAAAEALAEQAALDIAAKAFCRLAVPALLAPLELLEDVIPIIGEILDIAEIAATPALIDLCVKDVEKEGQAEFKVFGKEHTLSMDKPTATKEDRPSESSHSSASTSSCGNAAKRADEPGRCDPQFNKVVTTAIVDDWAALPVNPILCAAFGQACYNYRSVVNLNAAFETLTCAYRRVPVTGRPVYSTWLREHKTALWDPLIANLPVGGCSPDEYPPAVMADVNDGFDILTSTLDVAPRNFVDRGQRIRYLAAAQNGPAGKLFDRCGQGPVRTLDHPVESITAPGRRGTPTTYTKVRAVFTRSRFSLNFAGLDSPADNGIPSNPCIPTVQGVVHPGFQLANTDEWFGTHAAELAYTSNYASSPTKRDWIEGRGLVMINGNSSRVATPEELRQEFGFDSCSDDSCSRELKALRAVSDAVKEDFSLPPPPAPPTKPSTVDAEATPSPVNDTAIARDEPILISLPGSNSIDAEFPAETGRAASMPKKFPKFARGRGKH